MQARIKFFHKKHIPDNDYNNILHVNILSYVKIIIFEKSQVYTFMYVQTPMYRGAFQKHLWALKSKSPENFKIA